MLQVCVVCHQTGHGGIERAQGFLADNPQYTGRYYPQPFFTEEYADILAAAALSVTRAGAGSLWELAATCTPAVIIPLRSGTRGDQIRNADLFSQLGIGYVLQVSELNPAGFSGCIQRLLQDTEARSRMEAAARIFAADKGVKKLADVCEELLCS
ncbi:MAG: glycosyltransferase [Spirochaeta sp.]